MKIFFENVNFKSSTGPNNFAYKLREEFLNKGEQVVESVKGSDVRLCFIRSIHDSNVPLVQRLDGISFNSSDNYKSANKAAKKTYGLASSVIIQSRFDKRIIDNFFGTSPK